MKTSGITAVAFTSDTTESISQITDALSVVIIVFFISALILAFIVLYNLSNINIIERTREIATLKVLGFYDNEVSSYIYRENIFVSVFGIALGVVLGILLHLLLISFTAIDTVMYGQSIAWYSFVAAILITCLIIVSVNLLLHKKLKKVDMVEYDFTKGETATVMQEDKSFGLSSGDVIMLWRDMAGTAPVCEAYTIK